MPGGGSQASRCSRVRGNRSSPARGDGVGTLLPSWWHSPELLCQLSYRSARAPGAGLEPATCRFGSITGTVPARKGRTSRSCRAIGVCGVEPHGPKAALPVDNRIAPARDDLSDRPARTRTWTGEVGARCASGYTTGLREANDVRRSLRQESNPHLGRTKGACLPLTLRRLRWRRRESNPLLLVASEVLYRQSFVPSNRKWEARAAARSRPSRLAPTHAPTRGRGHAGGCRSRAAGSPDLARDPRWP